MRQAYAPLVWQCRFSGVEVPDQLWAHALTGAGLPYSENQAEDMIREEEIMSAFDRWTDHFASFVAEKGKAEPGEYRAFGYVAPGHRWADLKLKWRETRIRQGSLRRAHHRRLRRNSGSIRILASRPPKAKGKSSGTDRAGGHAWGAMAGTG